MKLYGYWRSSSAWRVRIALALKGVDYTYVPVNLLRGDQTGEAHRARNPMAQVPVLELPTGERLVQSMAIVDHLEQRWPDPPLFPSDPIARANAFALAELVNSGIQPLQNLAVLRQVEALGADRIAWGKGVIERGLAAFQQQARSTAGRYCVGDEVTVADLFLVPQLYNARRFGCDLEPLGLLTAIEARLVELPPFVQAHPDAQPDAVRGASG